jgi:ribosome-binding factor A
LRTKDQRRRKARALDADVLFGSSDRKLRRAKQLARQAEEALRFALVASSNEALRDSYIIDVEPAPDATRLAVRVVPPAGASIEEVEAALDRASGALRSAVAEAVTRKKAPALVFYVVPGLAP